MKIVIENYGMISTEATLIHTTRLNVTGASLMNVKYYCYFPLFLYYFYGDIQLWKSLIYFHLLVTFSSTWFHVGPWIVMLLCYVQKSFLFPCHVNVMFLRFFLSGKLNKVTLLKRLHHADVLCKYALKLAFWSLGMGRNTFESN